MKLKRGICLLLCMVMVLGMTACSKAEPPKQATFEEDVAAYITELLDERASITEFDELSSMQNDKQLKVICFAVYTSEEDTNEGEFTLTYRLKDKTWELENCQVVLQEDEAPVEEELTEEPTEEPVEVETPAEEPEEAEDHEEIEVHEEEPETVEPVYLNEMECASKMGKLWYKEDTDNTDGFDTKQELLAAKEQGISLWDDTEKPGITPGVPEDNRGNTYTYGLHIDGNGAKSYLMSFKLDGKYTVFSGTCACPSEQSIINLRAYDPDEGDEKYFEVYGDGKLLFASNVMNYDTDPQPFMIDVTGVDTMIISYPRTVSPNEIATIFDGMLS